jgi:hypothetical protein
MKYTKKWIKDYNKTWYYKITYIKKNSELPVGVISDQPIFILGIRTKFWMWKIAKSSYKWNYNL